jgi:hypothetical protein
MSARRIILRRAYRDQVPSRREHASAERAAARLGLPKLADRTTFQEWLRSKALLRTKA